MPRQSRRSWSTDVHTDLFLLQLRRSLRATKSVEKTAHCSLFPQQIEAMSGNKWNQFQVEWCLDVFDKLLPLLYAPTLWSISGRAEVSKRVNRKYKIQVELKTLLTLRSYATRQQWEERGKLGQGKRYIMNYKGDSTTSEHYFTKLHNEAAVTGERKVRVKSRKHHKLPRWLSKLRS